MAKNTPDDVDAYIAGAVSEARPHFNELRSIIQSTVPDAEEGISYGVPFYKYFGQFVGFDAFKNHVSFGFGSDVISDEDRKSLEAEGYKLGKGTLQVTFDQEVPEAAIKKILKTKAALNEAEHAAK